MEVKQRACLIDGADGAIAFNAVLLLLIKSMLCVFFQRDAEIHGDREARMKLYVLIERIDVLSTRIHTVLP
jgi:predicted lipid carrier protein YhbT